MFGNTGGQAVRDPAKRYRVIVEYDPSLAVIIQSMIWQEVHDFYEKHNADMSNLPTPIMLTNAQKKDLENRIKVHSASVDFVEEPQGNCAYV